MPTKKNDEPNCFYLACGLPWSENFPGVGDLIRHVNDKYFQSMWPVAVLSITLDEYIAGEQYHPSLFITYYRYSKEDLKNRQSYIQRNDKSGWAKDVFLSDVIEKETGAVVIADIRLPKGREQDNVPMLLNNVADYLENHGVKELLSFSFDSAVDDDSLNRPVIRIIFEKTTNSRK